MSSTETSPPPHAPRPHAMGTHGEGEALDEDFELDPAFVEDVVAALHAGDRERARSLL